MIRERKERQKTETKWSDLGCSKFETKLNADLRRAEKRSSNKCLHRTDLLHIRRLRESTGSNFDVSHTPDNILVNAMLGIVNMFVDEDEARLESMQSISERSASMPQKALKTEFNSIKFDLGIQSKTRVDGQNRAYQLKDVRIGGVYCQVLEPNSECDPQKKTKKSRFREAYLGSESSTTSEAYEIDRSESSWSSSEDSVSEEDIRYDRDRLVRKPNGGIDEERCMKFVLKSNTAINEIVVFLEDFILRDVIDTSKYRGFDIYQKTILDLTISHILNRKLDFSAEDNPLIIDDDFKPKRNDEKSKIIMSIILKTIINKYKRKLKIKQELRKKNLYLAIYYHFAYKGENYKLVSNTPDMKKRYKQAESSFKPKKWYHKVIRTKSMPFDIQQNN